ncbi:MAG TPA: MarR family transcriptional regulator, partial [Ktedonobacterales bacterium]
MSTRVDHSQPVSADAVQQLSKTEYERLANLRYALRRFSRQTELEARRVGLTPQQYLLLLSLKGFPGRDWASITELAERLQIRHNAVIGLVNRAEERNLVRRAQDPASADRRIVNIHITASGEHILMSMSAALRNERQRVRLALQAV